MPSLPRGEGNASLARKLHDFLVFQLHPCPVAIPAREVRRIGLPTDPSLRSLIDLGVILGNPPTAVEAGDGRRALSPLVAEPGWAIVTPREMDVVPATREQLLPLPELLPMPPWVAAILEIDGEALALVLSCDVILNEAYRQHQSSEPSPGAPRASEEGES